MFGRFFQFGRLETNFRTEVIAGVTTFLTMAYIIFVNPDILSKTGMDKNALVAITCIVTAIATLIVGFFAKAPIAMAPGMELNAFFTYTLVLGQGVKWETALGAVFGTSTTTSYIESAAGIEQGGRSGLTSVVTGLLFLAAVLFVPLVGVVPSYATAPALIMVGIFMMKEIKRVDFSNLEQAFPAYIIMVMIALSYSISTGLAFGFTSFVAIKLVLCKFKDIRPAMWVIAILSLEPILKTLWLRPAAPTVAGVRLHRQPTGCLFRLPWAQSVRSVSGRRVVIRIGSYYS